TPGPSVLLQAQTLVRLMHQTVGDRAEAERLLLPVLAAPVCGRAHTGVLSERRREVAERVEPHAMADLGDRQLRTAEEILRAVDAQPDQIPVGRNTHVRRELTGEVVGAEGGLAGDRP